jgi:hypothetical protein
MRTPMCLRLIALMLCLMGLASCQKQEEREPPPGNGQVEANAAYLENFGTPPQGKAGHAYARVGYLPLQRSPNKLRALPLFLFDDQNQLEQVLKRLISGDLIKDRKTDLFNPFPEDLKLVITSSEGPTVSLALTTGQTWAGDNLHSGLSALTETALQFDGVDRAIITLNGEPVSGMPEQGFTHNQSALSEVEPPRLILVSGVWEKDDPDDPKEILVEFDRPIKIREFNLFLEDGSKVEGDYYTSIFQMAVVVHPKNPERYQQGTVLRADWDVVDELGRANQGTDTLPLIRLEH